jgi:YNFM family putative membrane transporter
MRIFHLLLCSLFIFFVLYAPQPLLGLFATQFSVSPATAGSLMTATMVPLAIAPLIYGLILAKHNPLHILRYAMLGLAITCISITLVPRFELLLLIRFIQGLILPAALTAMTTYVGISYTADCLQKKMSLYIGSTIAGGYFGRVLASVFADLWNWQSFYYVIAAGLILLSLTMSNRAYQPTVKPQSPLSYLKQLATAPILKLYSAVFCMFFCFAALLNYLPFILQDTFLITNTRDIGFVYSGYLLGALASVTTPWLLKHSRSAWHLLCAVFAFYCTTIILLMSVELILFLIAFTGFCAAMFMIHSTAAPLVNKISMAPASVTNGGYVSFYYSGGALGSFVPGLVYQQYGNMAFLTMLLLVCVCGFMLVLSGYLAGKKTTFG